MYSLAPLNLINKAKSSFFSFSGKNPNSGAHQHWRVEQACTMWWLENIPRGDIFVYKVFFQSTAQKFGPLA